MSNLENIWNLLQSCREEVKSSFTEKSLILSDLFEEEGYILLANHFRCDAHNPECCILKTLEKKGYNWEDGVHHRREELYILKDRFIMAGYYV